MERDELVLQQLNPVTPSYVPGHTRRALLSQNVYFDRICRFREQDWLSFKQHALSKRCCLEESRITFDEYRPSTIRSSAFETWLKNVKLADETKSYDFRKVLKHLSPKKLDAGARKNADRREFKSLRDEGVFMVKDFFTFGFRTVEPEYCHVIMTANKHLDLFIPRRHLTFLDGEFPSAHQHEFVISPLASNSEKIFLPGDQYLLISPLKSIFYFKSHNLAELRESLQNEIHSH